MWVFFSGVGCGIIGLIVVIVVIDTISETRARTRSQRPKPTVHEILVRLDALERTNTEQWEQVQAIKREMSDTQDSIPPPL